MQSSCATFVRALRAERGDPNGFRPLTVELDRKAQRRSFSSRTALSFDRRIDADCADHRIQNVRRGIVPVPLEADDGAIGEFNKNMCAPHRFVTIVAGLASDLSDAAVGELACKQ